MAETAGHELLHKKEMVHKLVGNWTYTMFFYSHFLDEHTQGHHKTIATPEDPASADIGESVYYFIYKSCVGSHVQTWERDDERIRKIHGQNCGLVTRILYNKMTSFFVLHAIMCTVIYKFLGMAGLKQQFIFAFWGMFYLEVVNYVEHYGLRRRKDENGIFESVDPTHSWN